MFFNIGHKVLDNFPNHYKHNNLVINYDDGWKQTNTADSKVVIYKGYIDNSNINNAIENITSHKEPQHTGNFCLFYLTDNGVEIRTDRCRSFPLWYSKTHGIGNLAEFDKQIYSDAYVAIKDNLELHEVKFQIIKTINEDRLDIEQVVNIVDDILYKKIKNFYFNNNTLPLRVFLSGGIDTMTLYSYVLRLGIPHELVKYLHTDLDYFYLKNHHTLQNFWGYRQIHHWRDPCILLSGAPGDEFTCRSPSTANMLLRYHGTSILDSLDANTDSLHYKYFKNYSILFESQKNLKFYSFKSVLYKCINMILNDYQHWHLGNTLCFTPFRDIDIFNTIARLDKDSLIEQIFTSTIQLQLIKKNAPWLLGGLSTHKNTGNFMENLVTIYNGLPQDSSH